MRKDLFGGFPGGRFIGDEELKGISDVVRARSPYRFYGLDPQKKAETLESLCCDAFSRKYSLALSSGTAALHTALFALGVSRGDEVVLPAFAWGADLMAVIALGATPVIAPVDSTLGLDASGLEDSFSERTKAVIAVHMRGYPCDMTGILKASRSRGIRIIEDGAQCIGGKVDGLPVGASGDVSILSFQFNKLVTSGEGGVLLTNDPELYERAYRFHDLGMFRRLGEPDPEGLGSIGSFGLNYRMSELQAAFLIPQIKKMPDVLLGLEGAYVSAVEELSDICVEFGLTERKTPENTTANHAFLCLAAEDSGHADAAYERLIELGVPVNKGSRLDGHRFEVWTAFMDSNKVAYRCGDMKSTADLLDRALIFEINSMSR